MSFQGELKDLPLPDVVQLIDSSSKTGKLSLKTDSLRGDIFFEKGKIVHAILGDLSGEEAVHTMAVWTEGHFMFETNAIAEKKSITRSNTNLMMEGARRLDEWKVLQKKIPSTDLIPEFIPQSKNQAPQISLSTREWVLLSKVNGARDIKTIAKQSNLSVFETCKILYGLISSGLLALREKPSEEIEKIALEKREEKKEQAAVARVTVEAVISQIKTIAEEILGGLAAPIVEKHLKKCGVNPDDTNITKQKKYLNKAVVRIQKASASIIGSDAALQLSLRMEDSVSKLEG
ncbi:DUF4388 domain-containing protein [candidate division CSSED10-310 bacterium]|uniref:DUF4388 domain-containing protein n=1 Tax=candidate division CSSED10-310 bacterium TaxID=2855610 RepID=A0ABV6YRZ0_UNCC1